MRAAVPLIVAVAMLAYGYFGDVLINGAFDEASTTGDGGRLALLGAAFARLVGVGTLAALGWILLRGPRHALATGAMVVIGLYVAFVPALVIALIPDTDLTTLPLAVEAYQAPWSSLLLWMSAGVAVLGGMGLLWPSTEADLTQAAAEPEAVEPAAED